MLHITNGDCAAELLKATGLIDHPEEDLVLWRDVLEEGPTPAGLTLAQMTEVRAQFIASRGWGTYEEAFSLFHRRNQQISCFANYSEVIWWFEHDLHDQLHIAQSFDWFAQQELNNTQLSLICIDRFPGIEPFLGLGQLSPDQMASLFPHRQSISPAQLQLGQSAWQAYCSPEPSVLENWLKTDSSVLPQLAPALARSLEERPDSTGLTRTQQQLLWLVAEQVEDPVSLFKQNLAQETVLFYGDWSIWWMLEQLLNRKPPLLQLENPPFRWPSQCERGQFKQQRFKLTQAGQVLIRQLEQNGPGV